MTIKHVSLRFIAMLNGERSSLPPFLGPTLRGAFGSHFRRISCQTRAPNCNGCFLIHACPYPSVFDGFNPNKEGLLKDYKAVPQPFVLKVDLEPTNPESQTITWGFSLFGQATRFWPYIVYTFRQIGSTGLGAKRTTYRLISCIDEISQKVLWENGSADDTLKEPETFEICANKEIPEGLSTIRFSFETPVRIRSHGEEGMSTLSGLEIMLQGQRRHRIFEECFGTGDLGREPEYIEEGQFKTIYDSLEPWSIMRFSGRQKRKVKLQGLCGAISIRGPWSKTGDWLNVIESIHLGKSASFGLGRLKWEIENE